MTKAFWAIHILQRWTRTPSDQCTQIRAEQNFSSQPNCLFKTFYCNIPITKWKKL